MYIPIDPTKEYVPMEIFKHGFILNTVGKPDYRYVLRLIEAGKLKAKNVCKGKGKYYKILGADILTWKKSTTNIDEQPEVYTKPFRARRPYPQNS